MIVPIGIDERTGVDRPGELILDGVPVRQGMLKEGGRFELTDAAARVHRVEGTPAAYWPDGSIKWLHLCGLVDLAGGRRNDFALNLASPAEPKGEDSLKVRLSDKTVQIRGGLLDVDVQADVGHLLMVSQNGQARLAAPGISGRLVLVGPAGQNRRRYDLSFTDTKPQVVVQSAERVVVRLGGKFLDAKNQAISELILFVEIYRQSPEIRLEPVWIYLGNAQEDLVESLTLSVHRPIQTDRSLYALGNERGPGYWDVILPIKNDLGQGPSWPLARQVQLGSSFYQSEKCTFSQDASWLKIMEGQRSQGWCYLADGQFGLTAAMRYFWQEYPHSLTMDANTGTITFGLMPPEARPLDLRRYSPIMYGPAVYEYDKYSDDHGAIGLAKAHELMLRFSPAEVDLGPVLPIVRKPPTKSPTTNPEEARRQKSEQVSRQAVARRQVAERGLFFANPCRIMVDGGYFASTQVLGHLAAAGEGGQPQVESKLRRIMDYVMQERAYRGWYGLLDFGDVMTSFNADKDMWAYDDGGHAWLNTENLPDYGFWISALRSQRPDWLELAIEMSRHNRDLDTYHRGPFTGSGTRHGVNHWSDGDKEWRIGMPLVRRLHYYMTADPWTREYVFDTVAAYQRAGERTNVTAPSMTSAFAALLVRYEMTRDPADAQTLSNFADVFAQAIGPDGQLASSLQVDLRSGQGRISEDKPFESLFFFNTFGGQDALVDYAELTGHKALDQALIRYARRFAGPDRNADRAVLGFLAYAYRHTGEMIFREAIVKAINGGEFKTPAAGGEGVLDNPPHLTIPYNRAKQMCHYIGDPLHMIPYGLAVLEDAAGAQNGGR